MPKVSRECILGDFAREVIRPARSNSTIPKRFGRYIDCIPKRFGCQAEEVLGQNY